jgi:hypothetical protein
MASARLAIKNNLNTVWIDDGKRISLIEEVLPFRIRFTAIQIPGYNAQTVPPIPLQIIGYSNYIL